MIDVTAPPANAPRTWDFMLTGFFVFVELLLGVVFVLSSLTFGALNAGCVDCDATAIKIGQLLCLYAPPVIALVTIPWAISRVLRRRIGFGFALGGAVLMTLAFFAGSALISMGTPAV